jgi:hypothetical protein
VEQHYRPHHDGQVRHRRHAREDPEDQHDAADEVGEEYIRRDVVAEGQAEPRVDHHAEDVGSDHVVDVITVGDEGHAQHDPEDGGAKWAQSDL